MDTIAAIASSIASGGIGVIRISGPEAKSIVLQLFRKKIAHPYVPNKTEWTFSPHQLHHGYLIDPSTHELIDEVLVVFMPAPRSYTREDVIEIQSHAGYYLMQKILSAVLKLNARLAEPGEFTRRAFLNGRIDLSQAESIIDLVNARSEYNLHTAAHHLKGDMRHFVENHIALLTDVIVELQAGIEFPDELDCAALPDDFSERIKKKIFLPIFDLLKTYQETQVLRDGLRLCIIGRPNVGKSSLLNRLLTVDKAIVTPYPGTTRDPIEAQLMFEGIPVTLVDTAGLHQSSDPIETLGMEKTRENINSADFIILVLDATAQFSPMDQQILADVSGKNIIVVINKIDLVQKSAAVLPAGFEPSALGYISALTGQGLKELRFTLRHIFGLKSTDTECGGLVPNLRQKKSFEDACENLNRAVLGLEQHVPEDLILIDLESANRALKNIIGQGAGPDLLDRIFEQFCIGK